MTGDCHQEGCAIMYTDVLPNCNHQFTCSEVYSQSFTSKFPHCVICPLYVLKQPNLLLGHFCNLFSVIRVHGINRLHHTTLLRPWKEIPCRVRRIGVKASTYLSTLVFPSCLFRCTSPTKSAYQQSAVNKAENMTDTYNAACHGTI
jgi:hypothetical protein